MIIHDHIDNHNVRKYIIVCISILYTPLVNNTVL